MFSGFLNRLLGKLVRPSSSSWPLCSAVFTPILKRSSKSVKSMVVWRRSSSSSLKTVPRTWVGLRATQLRVGSLYLVCTLRLIVIAPVGACIMPGAGGGGMGAMGANVWRLWPGGGGQGGGGGGAGARGGGAGGGIGFGSFTQGTLFEVVARSSSSARPATKKINR